MDKKAQKACLSNSGIYPAQEGFVNLGLARQSQIDTNEEHHSQIGKGDEEGRFGKVAASPNSQKLTERGIVSYFLLLN